MDQLLKLHGESVIELSTRSTYEGYVDGRLLPFIGSIKVSTLDADVLTRSTQSCGAVGAHATATGNALITGLGERMSMTSVASRTSASELSTSTIQVILSGRCAALSVALDSRRTQSAWHPLVGETGTVARSCKSMQRNRQQQRRRLQGPEVVPLRWHRDQVTRPQLGP